jgi:hypothetical protein
LPSAFARHHDVGEDRVESLRLACSFCLLRIGGRAGLMPGALQDDGSDCLLIIDDEDPGHGGCVYHGQSDKPKFIYEFRLLILTDLNQCYPRSRLY